MIASQPLEPSAASRLYARVLRDVFAKHRPRRALILSARPEALCQEGLNGACVARFQTRAGVCWAPVVCDDLSLPFQLDCFDLVVLHGVVHRNDERLLAAVRRVMPGGSLLLIMGEPGLAISRLLPSRRSDVSLRPESLLSRLRQLTFLPEQVSGEGLAGLQCSTGSGWRRPLLMFSDRIAILARRSEAKPSVRLVRFSRPKAGLARPATLDGLSREIAS